MKPPSVKGAVIQGRTFSSVPQEVPFDKRGKKNRYKGEVKQKKWKKKEIVVKLNDVEGELINFRTRCEKKREKHCTKEKGKDKGGEMGRSRKRGGKGKKRGKEREPSWRETPCGVRRTFLLKSMGGEKKFRKRCSGQARGRGREEKKGPEKAKARHGDTPPKVGYAKGRGGKDRGKKGSRQTVSQSLGKGRGNDRVGGGCPDAGLGDSACCQIEGKEGKKGKKVLREKRV